MVVLLRCRRRRRRGAGLERPDDLYASAQVSWTLIHHAARALPFAVRALAVGVILPAFRALLVASPSFAHRLRSARSPAACTAVAVATVAVAAHEEELPALGAAADDEP
jgi:hypothetical protein